MNVQIINPSNEKILKRIPTASPRRIETALADSMIGYKLHSQRTLSERVGLLGNLRDQLRKQKDNLAREISLEMGKRISEAEAEVLKCADLAQYLIDNAVKQLEPVTVSASNPKAVVHFRPMGTIFCIMPWNFPIWQVMRFALPNLALGNTVILKHAPNVWGFAILLEQVFEDAGYKDFEFQNLNARVEDIEKIISDRRIAGVSITGSTRAGRSVGSLAGKYIKKSVLELGGSDAVLVLKDADLDLTIKKLVQGRMQNSGQSCVSPKRWIVDGAIYKEFVDRMETEIAKLKAGDPFKLESSLGPIARKDLRDQLHKQVKKSVSQGAKLVVGGVVSKEKGFFYPPTLLANVDSKNVAANEELFGPVGIAMKAKDEEHAIKLANQSDYGLGASVFSRDVDRANRILADRIEAGICFVNDFVRSDSRWPFGGVKDSGYGRELGQWGLLEFANVKSVVV